MNSTTRRRANGAKYLWRATENICTHYWNALIELNWWWRNECMCVCVWSVHLGLTLYTYKIYIYFSLSIRILINIYIYIYMYSRDKYIAYIYIYSWGWKICASLSNLTRFELVAWVHIVSVRNVFSMLVWRNGSKIGFSSVLTNVAACGGRK